MSSVLILVARSDWCESLRMVSVILVLLPVPGFSFRAVFEVVALLVLFGMRISPL